MTQICARNVTIIGSDNGLTPGRCQTIICTNTGILLIGPLGTNFSEILIGIQTFSFKKMPSKMSSAKWRPPCLGLDVLSFPSNWDVFGEHIFSIAQVGVAYMYSQRVAHSNWHSDWCIVLARLTSITLSRPIRDVQYDWSEIVFGWGYSYGCSVRAIYAWCCLTFGSYNFESWRIDFIVDGAQYIC